MELNESPNTTCLLSTINCVVFNYYKNLEFELRPIEPSPTSGLANKNTNAIL